MMSITAAAATLEPFSLAPIVVVIAIVVPLVLVLSLVLSLVLLMFAFARAQDLPSPAASGKVEKAGPGPDLGMSDPAVREAVRRTLAEHPPTPLAHDGNTLRADPYASFGRKMDEAEVPSCWAPDAMKHQPPQIGPIGIGGLLALPFWGLAIVRGKCNK